MVEFRYFNTEYKKVTNKTFSDSFVFFKDNWDDYGYNITFSVYYYDNDCGERYIGGYRIYETEIEEQENADGIKSIFKLSEDEFESNQKYSLASNLEFYQKLYKFCSEYYNDFLERNKDLTLIDLPEEIKEKKGVKKALLRNDGITKSEDIIDFNRELENIDSELNVGNYISSDKITDYFLTLLKDEKVEDLKHVVEVLVEKSNFNYDLLKKLIEHCIKNSSKDTHKIYYNTLISLVKKKNYEQLVSELETIEMGELKEISDSVNQIKNKLKYKPEDKNFVHYTSLRTLKFLLYKSDNEENDSNKSDENKYYPKLRLSNARQMNDPNEGYTFLNLIGIDKNDLPKTDYDTSPFFFASMTQTGDSQKLDDSLPMWKQYGDDARGICLTYHKQYIENLINDGIEIYKVCYNIDELNHEIEEIKKVFNKIKDPKDVKGQNLFSSALNLIDDIRYLFKDADYSYENEYRIIKSYEGKEDEIITCDSSNSVIPGIYTYIDKELKYSKIKLGPKCDDIDFVAPYIKFVDRNIEVTKSQISYR